MAKKSKTNVAETDVIAVNIGITADDRAKVASELSKVLADSYTLYMMTHNFHWNVTGPMFNTLHTMFMDQYTELWQALDLIAERIRALGHFAQVLMLNLPSFPLLQSPPPSPAQTKWSRCFWGQTRP